MASAKKSDPWFVRPKSHQDDRARLFCLPFAGGGASLYRAWPDAFPERLGVWAAQLPGRESRFNESRASNAVLLAKEIADALGPYLDRPFALFGYSIGALLAFEVARELRRRGGPQPVCLFIAAMHAPHVPRAHPPLAHLPSEEFIDRVFHYYQPIDEAWKIPELIEVFLPILRDDVLMSDTYVYANESPLPCPIEVYTGADDKSTPVSSAEAWREQTSADFKLTVFPGSHFFLHEALTELQHNVAIRMKNIIGVNPVGPE